MENTTQLFLAVRFNCNKCHDHPFERWTQDQYYQTGGLLRPGRPARTTRQRQGPEDRRHGRRGRPSRWSRSSTTRASGEVTHDRTGQVAAPKFPFTCDYDRRPSRRPRREQLAALDHLEGQPVLRQELRQPPLGLPARRRHHRADRRHPRRQPADQPRAARLPDRGVHQAAASTSRHVMRTDLQVADLSALGRDEQVERGRQDQLLARHRPPAAGRGALRRDPPRDRARSSKFPGVPPGTRAAELPDSGVELPSGFLDHVRPARRARAPASASAPAACSSARSWPWSTARPSPTRSPTRTTSSPSSSPARRTTRKLIDELFLRILNRPATPQEIEACLQRPPGDRRRPPQARAAARPGARSRSPLERPKLEKEREAAIAAAKAALAAYEKELGPEARRAGEAAGRERRAKLEAELKTYEATARRPSSPPGRRQQSARRPTGCRSSRKTLERDQRRRSSPSSPTARSSSRGKNDKAIVHGRGRDRPDGDHRRPARSAGRRPTAQQGPGPGARTATSC